MKIAPLLFILFFFNFYFSFGQINNDAISSGERHTIASQFLKEDRTFQIYLPPNYFFSEANTYPVVYLMDGDYNFHYDTGLFELLASVSGRIPEMIIVGISDKGSTKYKKNCTPNNKSEKEGNATNFISFIEKELKPHINQKYRTSDYDMIIGHSLGGLFTTHYFLENPKAFDNFIAIDPALWWGDFEIITRADSLFTGQEKLTSNYFISLANTKGMGIQQLVGVLDKHFPESTKWYFKHFEKENHNSVGLPTIKDAMLEIFKDWELSREQFYAFKNSKEFSAHYKKQAQQFSTSFALPEGFLANAVYYYARKGLTTDLDILESEIKKHFPASLDEFYIQLANNYFSTKKEKEAIAIYQRQIKNNPKSFKSYHGLSKIYAAKKEFKKALELSQKAVTIAQQLKVRQWLLNELNAHRESIQAELDKKN